MADIAAVVIQTLQWVGAPVTRQIQYLCCFTRNITSLRNEAKQLERTTQDLKRKVDTAINDLRVISPGVEIWLQNSNDIENETRGILDEVSNVESGCFKLGARFFLSRRAKKTTDRVKELRGRSNFQADDISQPAPPPATKAVPLSKTYNFDSRKSIEENIMITLRGEGMNMMGICGMGGLGKTTMAKRIMNRALEEHVLEEVVMAVVSRPIDKLKIQLEIGGSLGLKLEGETSQARVQKLHARLRGPKRILLVLDDVWERFQPEDLGIPCDYKGSLLPTRDTCPNMVKVIEEKEEEKEKVVSGAQRTTILFPKLHKILLFDLPELVRFCEWKCDVELPSLTEVKIYQCHNMKSFTLGPLNTPKLESVEINWKEFGGVKDLNGLVQQQYINRTEEKQAEEAEKKKGGEEEQERKGETEEEQN